MEVVSPVKGKKSIKKGRQSTSEGDLAFKSPENLKPISGRCSPTFDIREFIKSDVKNLDKPCVDSNRLSNHRKSYVEPEEHQEKSIQLSSKLKNGNLKGYLNYHCTQDMVTSVQEQYIKLHEQDLDAKKVIKPGFEKDNIPVKKQINTKGKGWFDFPENESKEVEKDYLVIQLRNAIDPKRFYKKPERKSGIPKFVQVGTVVTDPHDFYDRATKAERKPTLVEEMLANVESKKKIKKRFRTVKPMIAKKRQRAAMIKRHQKNDKRKHTKSRNNK